MADKYTATQIAKWEAEANDMFDTFDEIEPERQAIAAPPVSDADKAFVERAYNATKGINGKWLLLKVPTTIPIPIADQMLTDRVEVLREACRQTGYALRADKTSEKSPSTHARRFRVNLFVPRGKSGTTVEA